MVTQMLKINPHKSYHFLLVNCKNYFKGASVIYLLPCIEVLKNAFPQAKISVLIHSSMSDFFACNPYLSDIFCIDNKDIVSALKAAKIDISISLNADKSSTLALFKAKVKTRIGEFKRLYCILFNYKIKQKKDCKRHEIWHNVALLKPLGVKNILPPKIYLNINEKSLSYALLESKNMQNNLIILAPTKQSEISWNLSNFLSLASALSAHYTPLIVGNKDEIKLFKEMLDSKYNLKEENFFNVDFMESSIDSKGISNANFRAISYMRMLLSAISHARLVVGNHNALLHAASALNIPTLCIMPFIKSINPIKCAPLGKSDITITPFGIYNANTDSKEIIESNAPQGYQINSITYDLILDVIETKILKS